ncbi:hypothetical protein [Streptomyces sp. CA-132043]
MPTAGNHTEAIRKLDALDAMTPDQRLLPVLLEDDQSSVPQRWRMTAWL